MTQQAQPVAASDAFRLYDTATQSVRLFEPVVPGRVSIYHCGLTVQSGPHLGHIRKEVVFDVLRRWLTWCGYEVTVIANITDIDEGVCVIPDRRVPLVPNVGIVEGDGAVLVFDSGNELLIHAMKARTEYFDLLP